MIQQKLPPFLNVVNSGIATLQIPKYAMTMNRIVLRLGGTTFTKAMIAEIKIKFGVRTVYQISGSKLDTINKYKGIYDQDNFLTIDFSERDAPTLPGQQLGGIDMTQFADQITIEVTIAGATSPILDASAWMSAPQGNPLIHKLLYIPASSNAGGKFPIQLATRGALIKRVHVFYAGAAGTNTTDGNVNAVEVKKNGVTVWDQRDIEARFVQREYRKTPQSGLYCVDFIVDNNASSMLKTSDAASLEFNTYLTAADQLGVYVELIDSPYNA